MTSVPDRTLVRLVGVTKRYGLSRAAALHDVSLTLPGHCLVQVRGANSSGKSTLLRLLAGATRPTSGQILHRPRSVGYAPERYVPELGVTPTRYLGDLARIRALGRGAVGAVMERVGLTAYAGVSVGELSKGTTQRLVLAQALLGDPALLVLDEPWSGLDHAGQQLLRDVVAERVAAGTLVVLTDHDQRPHLQPSLLVEVDRGRVWTNPPTATGAAAPTPRARIVLRGRVLIDHLGPLVTGEGVERTGDTTTLTVADDDVDEVLRHVLGHGASVQEVRRCSP